MAVPKGFYDLVALAMKERPKPPKTREDLWEKFLSVIFMGGKRSEPEIQFIIKLLKSKNLVQFEPVLAIKGEDWRDKVEELLNERMPRIQDADNKALLKEFQKEIFRISYSIKGSVRFFNDITPENLAERLSTKEKTWKFIEDLANNEDVSNIKYTKIILWLHSIGYGYDFCPPSWHIKKFINSEVGPYYQFYEDDKYFMKKGEEFADEVKKTVKNATCRDVSVAIYYYMSLKNMMPQRSAVKKKCTPFAIIQFLKKKKIGLRDLSAALADFESREKILEALYEFLDKLR